MNNLWVRPTYTLLQQLFHQKIEQMKKKEIIALNLHNNL